MNRAGWLRIPYVVVALALLAGQWALGTTAVAAAPAPGPALTQMDPAVGPHARDERRHARDSLRLHPDRAAKNMPMLRAGSSASPAPSASPPSQPAPISGTSGQTLTGHTATYSVSSALAREVLGFAPYWELARESEWNYQLLSTVAYFGLDVLADGRFDMTSPGWTGWNSQELADMINRAHQNGVRVVLVIKQFDEETINTIVTNPAATQAAIGNTVNAIEARGLDGVNVDFEGRADAAHPNIQSGVTNFMSQLSSAVHQRWPAAEVSIDTYTSSASSDAGIFNIGQLSPYVDAFFVMAYDMVFSNMPGQAGPNAPLNGFTYNDTKAVSQYLAKTQASKVILGVPYYGYKWSTTSNQAYAQASSPASAVGYADIQLDLACALQLTRSWDNTAQSPWASWYSPASGDPCGGNHGSWRELYYDDAQSLGVKYDLVNGNDLRGAGVWALGYDGALGDLWNEIAIKFGSGSVRPPGFSSVAGTLAMIQGSSGTKGNFELVSPLAGGGLEHAWRNNDLPSLPWSFGAELGAGLGQVEAASLIQSNFGGHLEVIVRAGDGLYFFWREAGPTYAWHGPTQLISGVRGNPVLIQSRFGLKGNFEVVTPLAGGGLAHLWRNNDDPTLPWSAGAGFGQGLGQVDAVTLIQSNFGSPGNLEVIARAGDQLWTFWRDSGPSYAWHGPYLLGGGASGNPVLIQGRYGVRGNFELVTPLASGGLQHAWRNNDDPALAWSWDVGFGQSLGPVEAVTMIESNFGSPGNLEVVARQGSSLWAFYRDSTWPYAWHGPA